LVPLSVANMNREGPEFPSPSLTMKFEPPLETNPVGAPSTWTTSGTRLAGARVQSGNVRPVVRDPPRRGGTGDEAPGVDEVRIDVSGFAGHVGDKAGDRIDVCWRCVADAGSSRQNRERQ
jgi:hypothetical protein